MASGSHRHKSTAGKWVTATDGPHTHPEYESALAALKAAMESGGSTPPPDPTTDPAPPPTGPAVRTIGPGSYPSLTMNTPGLWDISPDAIIAGGTITAPGVWARGGTWTSTVTVKPFADKAIIEGALRKGGTYGWDVDQANGCIIRGCRTDGLKNEPFRLFGRNSDGVTGRAIDGFLLESNVVRNMQSVQMGTNIGVSLLFARGSEQAPYTLLNRNIVIQDNDLDQGRFYGQGAGTGYGHYGLELARCPGTIVRRNTLRGGSVLISFPDSDGCQVYENYGYLDVAPRFIEIANSDDVEVHHNTITGPAGQQRGWASDRNSNANRSNFHHNKVSNVQYVGEFDNRAGMNGSGHAIENNCVTNVGVIAHNAPGDTRLSNNVPTGCVA